MAKRPIQIYDQDELNAQADAHFEARAQHLKWCKERALAELDGAGCREAYASFLSDAGNKTWTSPRDGEQPPICDFTGPGVGIMLMQLGQKWALEEDHRQMRYWIEGFN